uniref:Major facilitator superfamily (MFS) profile domain-containing protein n=1 Tax=Tetradesmus obliquus TaxID=3088 RepID=A0A383VZ56_TETOB|eukprot:jgi/Sobl393_1/11357/SZX70200.1
MLPRDVDHRSDNSIKLEQQPAAANGAANKCTLRIAGAEQSNSINDQAAADVASALRKSSKVLLPLLFCTGLMNTLDRTNLSFAALQMNAQLHISAKEFGLASGLFFIGYGGCMLPSTFMTMRYGARAWYSAITVAWGVVATCNAFIRNASQLYALRVLLGALEAGSAPSAWHLLAQFYPQDRLAKPYAVMTLCHILSSIIAAPLAAGLLSLHGNGGLAGWQWLFIIEGVPSVAAGLAMLAWLPSHPLSARMLTQQEAAALHAAVHCSAEAAEAARQPVAWGELALLVWAVIKRPVMWLLVAIGVLWALCSVGLMTWLPIIISNMLAGTITAGGGSSSAASHTQRAALLSAIPYIFGGASTLLLAWHADRVNERSLHCAAVFVAGGAVLACFVLMYQAGFAAGFVALVVGMMAVFAGQPVMTCRVRASLQAKHAGIGLALFQAVSTVVGGFAGPYLFGSLLSQQQAFTAATVLMGCFLASSGLLAAGLGAAEQWQRRRSCVAEGQHALLS